MKLSLKLEDQQQISLPHLLKPHCHGQNPLLFRAKVPVTVFGLPFLSGVAATDPSDLSFYIRTNFRAGPYVKLCYPSTTASSDSATRPLILTLKSGVSLFGSPHKSPLIISAHFAFSPQNPNPTFSLQFKPNFGHFSFCKTTRSTPSPNQNHNHKADVGVNSIGFVPLESPTAWKDWTMESYSSKASILSGIAVRAKTELPVTKRVAVNFRWAANFPADIGKQLPFLSVNKIGIERLDEVKEVKELKISRNEGNVDDMEMFKGMCLWMKRELDVLQRENRELKQMFEELKFGQPLANHGVNNHATGKKSLPVVDNSGDFREWRGKKSGGQANGVKESKKKSVNQPVDVESELERAIKAASFH